MKDIKALENKLYSINLDLDPSRSTNSKAMEIRAEEAKQRAKLVQALVKQEVEKQKEVSKTLVRRMSAFFGAKEPTKEEIAAKINDEVEKAHTASASESKNQYVTIFTTLDPLKYGAAIQAILDQAQAMRDIYIYLPSAYKATDEHSNTGVKVTFGSNVNKDFKEEKVKVKQKNALGEETDIEEEREFKASSVSTEEMYFSANINKKDEHPHLIDEALIKILQTNGSKYALPENSEVYFPGKDSAEAKEMLKTQMLGLIRELTALKAEEVRAETEMLARRQGVKMDFNPSTVNLGPEVKALEAKLGGQAVSFSAKHRVQTGDMNAEEFTTEELAQATGYPVVHSFAVEYGHANEINIYQVTDADGVDSYMLAFYDAPDQMYEILGTEKDLEGNATITIKTVEGEHPQSVYLNGDADNQWFEYLQDFSQYKAENQQLKQ